MILLANSLFWRLIWKMHLKPANANAIIRTVSRIIFNPSRRSPQEGRAGQWDQPVGPASGRCSDECLAARVTVGRIDPSGSGAWLALQRSRDLRSRTAEHLVSHLGL